MLCSQRGGHQTHPPPPRERPCLSFPVEKEPVRGWGGGPGLAAAPGGGEEKAAGPVPPPYLQLFLESDPGLYLMELIKYLGRQRRALPGAGTEVAGRAEPIPAAIPSPEPHLGCSFVCPITSSALKPKPASLQEEPKHGPVIALPESITLPGKIIPSELSLTTFALARWPNP